MAPLHHSTGMLCCNMKLVKLPVRPTKILSKQTLDSIVVSHLNLT